MPGGDLRHFVMICTTSPTRYYQFIGGADFKKMFSEYKSRGIAAGTELPGDLTYTDLKLYREDSGAKAKSFAMLTGSGIYHGSLMYGKQGPGDDVILDHHLVSLESTPLSVGLTEFHFVCIYPNRIVFINKLNEEIVQSEFLDPSSWGTLRGTVCDSYGNITWLFSDARIFQVRADREDRNVWKIFLDKAMSGDGSEFDDAYTYCQDINQRKMVRLAQADHYFRHKEYSAAAKYYASTHKSFEKVALQFIEEGQREGLKIYLLEKLKSFAANQKPQKTLVSMWLVSIYLGELSAISNDEVTATTERGPGATPDRKGEKKFKTKAEELSNEFKQFLYRYKACLNPETTFSLIGSHGRMEELLFYANQIEDYEKLVVYYIQRGDYENALYVLANAPTEKVQDLYYRFASNFIEEIPTQTVNCWIAASQLDPCKLIPALARYSQKRRGSKKKQVDTDEAVRYLEYSIFTNKRKDAAIHNYLLTLYAALPDEGKLVEFICESQSARFDLEYALRVCLREEKKRSCVHIYGLMGLYEEAVDLALDFDAKFASQFADSPEDEYLRKKLWLKIVKRVIESTGDIKSAIDIVHSASKRNDSEPPIKIEDILHFIPDEVTLEDFKDEICDTVKKYSASIEQLKSEMEEYTTNAERIRSDIKSLRGRYGYVGGAQGCDLCFQPVLNRHFYLFPCTHSFHADCMTNATMKQLNNAQVKRVKQLQKLLQSEERPKLEKQSSASIVTGELGPDGELITNMPESFGSEDSLQSELDNIIAAECYWCGSNMIKTISEPLIQASDAEEANEWLL
jgi:hypothetical protein